MEPLSRALTLWIPMARITADRPGRDRWRPESVTNSVMPVAQLRALMYVATLTSEIMDSMVALENAVEGALERQTTFRASLHWRKKTAVYQRCAAIL